MLFLCKRGSRSHGPLQLGEAGPVPCVATGPPTSDQYSLHGVP